MCAYQFDKHRSHEIILKFNPPKSIQCWSGNRLLTQTFPIHMHELNMFLFLLWNASHNPHPHIHLYRSIHSVGSEVRWRLFTGVAVRSLLSSTAHANENICFHVKREHIRLLSQEQRHQRNGTLLLWAFGLNYWTFSRRAMDWCRLFGKIELIHTQRVNMLTCRLLPSHPIRDDDWMFRCGHRWLSVYLETMQHDDVESMEYCNYVNKIVILMMAKLIITYIRRTRSLQSTSFRIRKDDVNGVESEPHPTILFICFTSLLTESFR